MPRRKKPTTDNQPKAANPFREFISQLTPHAPVIDAEVMDDELVWATPPPDLPTFIESPAYLGLPPLSTQQLKAFVEGLEHDGDMLFSNKNKYNEIVLCWGKGSGKDYVSSIIIAYVAYVTCCLKNPQAWLGLAPGENLDIVNVATRAEQAKDVFFGKLVARINSPCFAKFRPQISRNKVFFLNKPGVNLYSLHSKAQKWEGYNLLAWVMDEADAFQTNEGTQNAEEVYNVLSSSAASRFPDKRWIGLIISYPRSDNGFMLTHAQQMKEIDRAYVDIQPTWNVHPFYDPNHPSFKDFPWVRVYDRYDVPEPFEVFFLNNPVDSAMSYMCIPPPLVGAFFEYPDLLEECARPELEPAAWVLPSATNRTLTVKATDAMTGEIVEREETARYTAMYISRKIKEAEPCHYYIHGDPGETRDAFALCLGHTLPDVSRIETMDKEVTLNRVEIDLMIEWKPAHNQPVDYINVRETIIQLCRWYPVIQVTFDKFQSAQIIQELRDVDIMAKQMSFSRADQLAMYQSLKIMTYNRLITWPKAQWPLLRPQLVYLIQKGNQITHDEKRSAKDVADAVAAVSWYASGAHFGRSGRDVLESMYGDNVVHQQGIIRRKLTTL